MKTTFLLLIFLGTIISCSDNNEYAQERIEILHKTPFDETVVSNINQYDSIRAILIVNMDELFDKEQRDCRISRDYGYKDHKFNYKGKNVTQLPSSLSEVERLFDKLGKKNIKGLYVYKDSSIMLSIRSKHISELFSDVIESLHCDKKRRTPINETNPYSKDTMINNIWRYQIWVDKRYGW